MALRTAVGRPVAVMLIRQMVSILLLPFTVAVLVPWRIAGRAPTAFTAPDGLVDVAVLLGGMACGVLGLTLFTWSLQRFWTQGRGTLAPWDPPQRLVISGPYRYVRNPMISGVLFVLLSEACLLRSIPILEWTGLFVGINAIYIPLLEEPQLRARFGEPYAQYARSVRRLIPRLTPYQA